MPTRKPAADRAPDKSWASKPKENRFREALKRIDAGMPVATAARSMGLSRSQVNVRLKVARDERAAAQGRAADSLAGKANLTQNRTAGPLDDQKMRVLPFDDFDQKYFGTLVCPDCGVHHETPGFHTEIADAVLDPDIKRLLINIPPYHSKSALVTVKSTVYELVCNPNGRHLIVSASQDFAKAFLYSIKQWLTNPELYEGAGGNLIDDYGPFFNDTSTDTQTKMYIAGRMSSEKDPSVLALGIGNQIYGRRADRIIFDDIATLENQRNPEMVIKQMEWIDKQALSRIGRTGKAIWVGTRIRPGDIYTGLQDRTGYKIIKYPCILDEEAESTLWPDHFPYPDASLRRAEMRPEEWQLVYQNVDTPGLGSSFPAEVIEECKDREHVIGQVDPAWKLFVGIDPAGGGKQSGFTALILLGWDRDKQELHLVDMVNARALKAYQLKDQILDWAASYNLTEIRVESNGVQSQLVQYNQELINPLTQRGIRVVSHHTHSNKWDAQFGVEAIAPWFYNQKVFLPWGNADSQRRVQTLIEQLAGFPMAERSDLVMAFWFAWLGIKESQARQPGPMYENRKMPAFVRNRRRIADMRTGKLWSPTDPSRPDFGRIDDTRPRNVARLVNVPGQVNTW